MKIKVTEASGKVLDWLVAKAEAGREELVSYKVEQGRVWLVRQTPKYPNLGPLVLGYQPSTYPAQGHEILERECISVIAFSYSGKTRWNAFAKNEGKDCNYIDVYDGDGVTGSTMLEAGLRCYTLRKLGSEVGVPNSLLPDPHAWCDKYISEQAAAYGMTPEAKQELFSSAADLSEHDEIKELKNANYN